MIIIINLLKLKNRDIMSVDNKQRSFFSGKCESDMPLSTSDTTEDLNTKKDIL